MKLEDVIKEYHKNGKNIVVVPKYGENYWSKFQRIGPNGGFKITKYDKKRGSVELTSMNNQGKKTVAYMNVDNIAILVDDSDVWNEKNDKPIDLTNLLKEYHGKDLHLAVTKDYSKVVGTGKTMEEAIKVAEEAGYKDIILMHSPDDTSGNSI